MGRPESRRRLLKTAAAAARRPRDAYNILYSRMVSPPRRFDEAMWLLTGLDVTVSFERDGVTWQLQPGQDGIAESLFATGSYGEDGIEAVVEYARSHRPGKRWIIDVGANIGTSTVPFALAGYHVLAAEPVPKAFRHLEHNVTVNGLAERVRLLEAAITDGPDEVLMAVSSSLGNSEIVGDASDGAGFELRYGREETISVPALGLDDAVDAEGIDVDSVAVVWSDTQGFEGGVISTGARLWAAGVPLFAEFSPYLLGLHGGVDEFVATATEHFDSYLPLDALVRGSTASMPLTGLPGLAERLVVDRPTGFTDVLLLP